MNLDEIRTASELRDTYYRQQESLRALEAINRRGTIKLHFDAPGNTGNSERSHSIDLRAHPDDRNFVDAALKSIAWMLRARIRRTAARLKALGVDVS